jgi:transcription initiation factor TFIIIB Brf1 subunit/transcription initiation factor TFIIB
MACQESNDRRVQRVIAEAAGTTEVTLRNRYRGLKEVLDGAPALDTPAPVAQ